MSDENALAPLVAVAPVGEALTDEDFVTDAPDALDMPEG